MNKNDLKKLIRESMADLVREAVREELQALFTNLIAENGNRPAARKQSILDETVDLGDTEYRTIKRTTQSLKPVPQKSPLTKAQIAQRMGLSLPEHSFGTDRTPTKTIEGAPVPDTPEVAAVASVINRDFSGLMKAMNKKQGNG